MFKRFSKELGIKREYTVPHNPEQNGVVQRKNRTIIEVTRAMIFDQNLEYYLWAETSCTIVYIQNRSPHSYLRDKTPEEVFTKVKPNISHLRIFGCPVYIHVPKEKRTKLEPSKRKGIFVGYSETSKAYRIFILGQKNIELSRDAIFEEDLAFKRVLPSEEPSPQRENIEEIEDEIQNLNLEETQNSKKR